MSTVLALILLCLALALIVSIAVVTPRPGSRPRSEDRPVADGVESPLLRRPLRSRHPA